MIQVRDKTDTYLVRNYCCTHTRSYAAYKAEKGDVTSMVEGILNVSVDYTSG